ncbi:hypothetical protein ABK040_007531 [Willaertia magna]
MYNRLTNSNNKEVETKVAKTFKFIVAKRLYLRQFSIIIMSKVVSIPRYLCSILKMSKTVLNKLNKLLVKWIRMKLNLNYFLSKAVLYRDSSKSGLNITILLDLKVIKSLVSCVRFINSYAPLTRNFARKCWTKKSREVY